MVDGKFIFPIFDISDVSFVKKKIYEGELPVYKEIAEVGYIQRIDKYFFFRRNIKIEINSKEDFLKYFKDVFSKDTENVYVRLNSDVMMTLAYVF
ncbi:MAG: hypothetical protein RML94_09270 [Bacteroidia bacterium]|nr:hypothetical protein [Bacteroidia bacterium]